MKSYESLSITITRFESQDVITSSCVCIVEGACWYPDDQMPHEYGNQVIHHSNGCTADVHYCLSNSYSDLFNP